MPFKRLLKKRHIICMSAIAAAVGKRFLGPSFVRISSGASLALRRPGGRIDVLSRHLSAVAGSRLKATGTHGKSRAAIVAAATAAGMAAGGVLVADGPKEKDGSKKGVKRKASQW